MRILAHVHSLNDEDVIDRCLESLLKQTRPLDAILLVDNGSTDRTLVRSFPDSVRIIRNTQNIGTSGAVVTGFQYALANGYDWIWLFDADTAPRPDALAQLLDLFQSFPADRQARVWLLASLPVNAVDGRPHHGAVLTPRGPRFVRPQPGQAYYRCDVAIWSGSLYQLSAVRHVGLPRADYVLDWGEFQYGYAGKRLGYEALTHQDSIVEHNIGGIPSLYSRIYRLGPLSLEFKEFPPIRCYFYFKNLLRFWMHEYEGQKLFLGLVCVRKMLPLVTSFLVRPLAHQKELAACIRGFLAGLFYRPAPHDTAIAARPSSAHLGGDHR